MCLSMMIVKCIKQLNASDALIETSQLICRANQLTDFYMMATLAFNELIYQRIRFSGTLQTTYRLFFVLFQEVTSQS